MTLSAISFALILTAFQQPAYGEELVIAAGDEYATEQQLIGPELAPVDTAPSTDDKLKAVEFDRLFGEAQDSKLSNAEQSVVAQARAVAWPWWVWPLGLLVIGVLLIVRSRVQNQEFPAEAIRVLSRQVMGKDGTLALIEVHDGDSRKRRLLVGLGGGAPRLVADVSAWEVAVAAPSNIDNQAVAIVGPDPIPTPTATTEINPPVKTARPTLRVASFDGQLREAVQRYDTPKDEPLSSKRDLIDEVMAQREVVRKTSEGELSKTGSIRAAKPRPTYSTREVKA